MIGLLKGKISNIFRYIIVKRLLSIPIQHLFAIAFIFFHNGFNLIVTVITVSASFLTGDIIKFMFASETGITLNKNLMKNIFKENMITNDFNKKTVF